MLADSPELVDHPILITGASSGIGLACAQLLLQGGARHLIITGRDADKLANAKKYLNETNDASIDARVCDHVSRADIDRLFAEMEPGRWPAALVANVGVNPVHQHGPKKLHNHDYESITSAITTNISHTLYLIANIVKHMRSQRFGRIVLMGSQGWQHGIAGQALYNVSKSSLAGLKNAIASEYASSNIFCHLLNPGLVLNERTLKLRERNPQLAHQHGITQMHVAEKVVGLLCITDKEMNGQDINV